MQSHNDLYSVFKLVQLIDKKDKLITHFSVINRNYLYIYIMYLYLSRFMDLCAHSVFVYVGGPARCACQRCLVTVHLTR